MPVSREEFEALVGRMEAAAAADPVAYRRRVFGWAAMGYAWLALVLAVLIGLMALIAFAVSRPNALSIKLLFVLGALLWAVVRALHVRLQPPSGIPLTAAEAPQLFATIERLRATLHAGPVHQVLVTPEFNAAISQISHFGPIGPCRNVLILGLPLMKSLTREQFESVIAHELGHLAGGHARSGNWIYRLRLIWARLEASLTEDGPWGSGVIRGFLRWYIPRFNAISFPFARANEYEADAAAVRATSPRVASQALTSVHVMGAYLEEKYWPTIHSEAREHAAPDGFKPYAQFVAHGVADVPVPERDRWQALAMATPTSAADTHPSLADRIRAMGHAPEFAPPAAGEEAASLLGGARIPVETRLDEQWSLDVAPSWREFHEKVRNGLARRVELEHRRALGPLDEAQFLELAQVEDAYGAGLAASTAILREGFAAWPSSIDLAFALGRALLLAGDESGIALVDRATLNRPVFRLEGVELIVRFLRGQGRPEEAARWAAALNEATDVQIAAHQERNQLLIDDAYAEADLPANVREHLVRQLASIPQIRKAWLVRKQVAHFADHPLYVLGFDCTPFWKWQSPRRTAGAMAELRGAIAWPGETLFLCVEQPYHRFRKKFRRIRGSRLK